MGVGRSLGISDCVCVDDVPNSVFCSSWQLAVRRDDAGGVDAARTMEPVPALVGAGVTVLSTGINPRIVRTMDDVRAYLDALATAFAAL